MKKLSYTCKRTEKDKNETCETESQEDLKEKRR
jgi:hypothetical protein